MAPDVLQAASGLKKQLESNVKAAQKRQAAAEAKLASVKKQIVGAETEASASAAAVAEWSSKLAQFDAIGLAKSKTSSQAKAKTPPVKKAKGKAKGKKAKAKAPVKKSGPAPLPRTASGEIDWRTKAGRAHKAKLQAAGKWKGDEKPKGKVAKKKAAKKGKVAKKKAAAKPKGKVAKKKAKAAAAPKAKAKAAPKAKATKKGNVAKKAAAKPKAKAKVAKKAPKKSGDRPTLREAIIISMRGTEVFQAKDVHKALEARGWLPNTSNDPVAYLSFTLSKYKDSFKRVKWGHYCVIGKNAGTTAKAAPAKATKKAPAKKGKKAASPKGNGAEVAKPQTKDEPAPKSAEKVDQDMADIGISASGVADNPFTE